MIKENHEIYLKLHKAAGQLQKREIEILEKEAALIEPYIFSNRFNRKMYKLMKFSIKPYFNFVNTAGKRAAVIIIAFITAFSIATFSIKALREPVIDFIVSVYEKFSNILFNEEETKSSFPTIIEEFYQPKYLPTGYVEIENNNLINVIEIIYSNGVDDLIFEQYIIGSAQVGIDTEGAEVEMLIVDGGKMLFYSNKGINNIVWKDESYGYSIRGIINKSEMLNMVALTKY